MKILIVYGTTEGQTRKIARFMEDLLQEEGHQVAIADASEDPPTPNGYQAVLVGSSIHMHKYHPSVVNYVLEHVDELSSMPSAFFSVCMAVASELEEEHAEAHTIAETFLDKTCWNADGTAHIAGALKYTKYDYFKRLIMRMIAKKQGGSTDTSTDHEYTDWEAVRRFALDFANNAAG